MESNCSKFSKRDFLFLGVFLTVFIVQIWKAHIGMGFQDEYFHIATGYRIAQGDAMFVDEWHITQIIAFFLAPLVKLFLLINGSTDGIVLAFRLIYVLLTMLISSAIYLRFRRFGLSACAGAILYALYTPFNLMELSYNTMGISFLVLSLLILDERQSCMDRQFLSGVFFSFAVINTPYLSAFYLAFSVYALRLKKVRVKQWGSFTVGILLVATVFLIFVFSRATLHQIIVNIPNLVDKGHNDGIVIQFAKNAGKLFQAFRLWMVLFALELIVSILKKPRDNSDLLISVFGVLNCLAAVYVTLINPYYPEIGGFTLLLVPLFMTGVRYFLINHENISSYITLCFVLPVVQSLMIAASSNVGPRSFVCPLIFSCSIAVMMITKDSAQKRMKALIPFYFVLLLFFKITNVYDGSGNYETRIKEGPLAGLYDSLENNDKYMRSLEDIRMINQMNGENAYLITWNTWEYLALEKRIATNSTFINSAFEQEWFDNQDEYYITHPERFPAFMYLDHWNSPFQLTSDDDQMGKYEYMQEMNSGTLFIRH